MERRSQLIQPEDGHLGLDRPGYLATELPKMPVEKILHPDYE
jgi:hypothetical protein